MTIGLLAFLLIFFLPELWLFGRWLHRRYRRPAARVPTRGMAKRDP